MTLRWLVIFWTGQNKMVYSEEPTWQMPPHREWIFTRTDTGARVGVKFNLAVITPLATPERQAMGRKLAAASTRFHAGHRLYH